MGIRRLVALGIAVLLAGGAALSTRGGDDGQQVTMATAVEEGAPGNGIVFYSGAGEAGIPGADRYSDWEYVDNNEDGGRVYSDYSPGNCATGDASIHPADRNLHVLVGFSKGRLGPVYFLQNRSRWTEVDTIWLLDPGTKGEMGGSCDAELELYPGNYLAEWLAGGANRHLVIIEAGATNVDDGAGVRWYYLAAIGVYPQSVADRVTVCVDEDTGHDDVPRVYMPQVASWGGCPSSTTNVPVEGVAPQAPPPATSPPVTSPPATSAPTTAPAPTGPPATSPPATSPPATSPPPTSPPTTQPPSRVITVYNMVTNGGTQMREDTPAYLSTVTQNYCKSNGCALGGTDMGTGARITAVCQTQGSRTTNGQDNSSIDDGNPGLYSSTRWYGIRWGDGRFGYISEVWINSADRGGLGLPGC